MIRRASRSRLPLSMAGLGAVTVFGVLACSTLKERAPEGDDDSEGIVVYPTSQPPVPEPIVDAPRTSVDKVEKERKEGEGQKKPEEKRANQPGRFDPSSTSYKALPVPPDSKPANELPPPSTPLTTTTELEPKSGGDQFAKLAPNPFVNTERDRFSTFAVDVDTASYTVSRRIIDEGRLPPPEAVRVEEYVNYFRYRYPAPLAGAFTVNLEGAPSPFTRGHHILRIGLQGKVVSKSQRLPAHLVFLVDTSGSMASPDRLPLAQEAVKLAVRNLNENDTVALVTYAGSTRDVLGPTPASDLRTIFAAVDSLSSGGGTAMGSGLELAYRHAVKKARAGVVSRVVVLTDGDTNLGPNLTADSMLEAVQKYVKEGVTLSTVGFGMGNYRDDLMERLANKGNGNCFYIDGMREAKRVFEEKLAGTTEVIAKDVKIQVELNPKAVRTYRLLGYENRDIADRDFRDDKVDAGEIGAGHTVTALYEVQLAPAIDGDLAMVRIRAKEPFGSQAFEQKFPFSKNQMRDRMADASPDFRFALAVAGAADVLRHSRASEGWSLVSAAQLAEGAVDGMADRKEFVSLIRKASELWARQRSVAGN